MYVEKYNASGNDFVIFHTDKRKNRQDLAKILCDRHEGVGADGLVVLLPHKDYDFEWEFYNSDGSIASMCGNATRAVAHYAIDKGISVNGKAHFLTGAGEISVVVNGVYANTTMPNPRIIREDIEEFGKNWWLIDTGVPHLVTQVEKIEDFDLEIARELREKYNANVNVYFLNEDCMRVRTYERGVEDETLACGTGIMACYVRALRLDTISEQSKVFPKSGEELYVEYSEQKYKFGGKVSKVFKAELTLDIPTFML